MLILPGTNVVLAWNRSLVRLAGASRARAPSSRGRGRRGSPAAWASRRWPSSPRAGGTRAGRRGRWSESRVAALDVGRARRRRSGDPAAAPSISPRSHGPRWEGRGGTSAREDGGEGAGPREATFLRSGARGAGPRGCGRRPRRGADAAGGSGWEPGARAAAEDWRREAGRRWAPLSAWALRPEETREPRRAEGARHPLDGRRRPRPSACSARRGFSSRPWAEATAASRNDMHLPGAA